MSASDNRVSVDAAFFRKLSAWENLSYAARLYGVPIGEARKRARDPNALCVTRRYKPTGSKLGDW
jgi:hypothetical protein